MSLDILVVVLVSFFLAPLLSTLGPWLQKQWKALEQHAEEEVAKASGKPGSVPAKPRPVREARPRRVPEATVRPATDPWRGPARPAAVRAAAARTVPLPGLRNREELRRSMVLMAVLGPCRSIEPWTPEMRSPGQVRS